jgi:diaminopimelate decarboxylase
MVIPDATTAHSLAETFGTPAYIYSEPALRRAAEDCLAFPNPFGLTVRFAMKALPNAAVLQLFDECGLHFDASSVWEARRALAAGIEADKISLSSQELGAGFEELVRLGVKVNACSLRQLDLYGKAFPGTSVGVRLNPGAGSGHNNRTNTGGPASSFGIWHENIPRILEIAAIHDLTIHRLHTHVGSGGDPAVWRKVATLSLRHLPDFPEVKTLNLGGGFKVARMPGEAQSDLQTVGRAVKTILEQTAAETGRRLHLEIEPGTYLTALAGVVLSRVQDIVDTGSKGYTFLKLDCGLNDILRPSLYGARHDFRVFPRREGSASKPTAEPKAVVVVGHCCESGDLLTPAAGQPELLEPRLLPPCEIGDIVCIEGSGAYVSAMCAQNYNSFPVSPEILLQPPHPPRLIRQRQPFEEVWQNECGNGKKNCQTDPSR